MLRLRPRLPVDVRATLGPDVAVLAFERLVDEAWVVATREGLGVIRGDEVILHAWTDVDGARLDAENDTLNVTWVDGTPATALALAEGWRAALPRFVHNRVQASVVHSERVSLPGGEVARVVLRRGAAGELFTQVIGTGSVVLDDAEVSRLVGAAEARVRESAGL